MQRVEIKPLPEKKWHGKKNKESFAQPKAVEVLIGSNGKYATGLTIDEAKEYSAKMGVDLSDSVTPGTPHPYWSQKSAWVSLPNHTLVLDVSKPAEYVKWKNSKASKLVANSMQEWEAGKWPDATHVIFDENEEVEMKASKVALRNKATVLANKMSKDAKIAMIQILSQKTARGRSENFVEVTTSELIEQNPEEFLRYANMGPEDVNIRGKLYEMLDLGILNKEAGAIFYLSEKIGIDFEAAVDWYKNPTNEKMKVAILERLDSQVR